ADAQGFFERERAAHQFAVDSFETAIGQGALIELANLVQHLAFAIRRIDWRLELVFDLSDLNDDVGALVEQLDDAFVEFVDLRAQGFKRRVFAGVHAGTLSDASAGNQSLVGRLLCAAGALDRFKLLLQAARFSRRLRRRWRRLDDLSRGIGGGLRGRDG